MHVTPKKISALLSACFTILLLAAFALSVQAQTQTNTAPHSVVIKNATVMT
jgi:hypothetical protein